MGEIINNRQIIKDLLEKTNSGEIRWRVEIERSTDYMQSFKYIKKVTKLKSLTFIITARNNVNNSDLTILYGPKEEETLVALITIQGIPALYNLIDTLVYKYKAGEIKPIRESMQEWGGAAERASDSADKMKNLRFLNLLLKNTEDGKINWEDTYIDDDLSVFLAVHQITPLKSLTFIAKTSLNSKDKDENILRVTLKKRKNEEALGDVKVIRALRLIDYPILFNLFKLINKKYIDREYTSPHAKKSVEKSVSVTANNIDEYKFHILEEIRSLIRQLPVSKNYEHVSEELWELYQKCKLSNDYDNIGSMLYRAKQLMEPTSDHGWY
jgi:hypothetical protein